MSRNKIPNGIPLMQIPSGYMALATAANEFHMPVQFIEEWADQKQVRRRAHKGYAFYREADVKRMAEAQRQRWREARARILAEEAQAAASQKAVEQAKAAEARVQAMPLAEIARKRYVTLAEAERLDGRNRQLLYRLAKAAGKLMKKAGPDGADLILQTDVRRLKDRKARS